MVPRDRRWVALPHHSQTPELASTVSKLSLLHLLLSLFFLPPPPKEGSEANLTDKRVNAGVTLRGSETIVSR